MVEGSEENLDGIQELDDSLKSEESETDFMETYVNQMFREHVDPLKEEVQSKTEKLLEVTLHAKKIDKELKQVNEKYDDACRGILKTQGLVVLDLDSHSIFKEYQLRMNNQQKKLQDRKMKKYDSKSFTLRGQTNKNRDALSP